QQGGGNSILWGTFHVARHAALALLVLNSNDAVNDVFSPGRVGATSPGGGLEEAEQPWATELTVAGVDHYFAEVGDAAQRFLQASTLDRLDEYPDVDATLEAAGVGREDYPWLYKM